MKTILILFFSLFSFCAQAQLDLPEDDFIFRPLDNLEFHIDETGRQTVEEVRLPVTKFSRHELRSGNFGFTKKPVWAKFDLNHPSGKTRKIYLDIEYGFYDHLEFYFYKDNELIEEIKTGDTLIHQDRPLFTNGFSFPLELGASGSYSVYLKFQAQESMQIPVSLLSEKNYIEKVQRNQIYLGILFGGIFSILIYNLFLWSATREKAYLTYFIYIFTHLLFQLAYTGLGFQYLWTEFPKFHNLSIPFFGLVNISAFAYFTRNYLRLNFKWPLMDKAFHGLGVISLSSLIIMPWVEIQTMIIVLVFFHTILALLVPVPVFKLIHNGDRVALYYLAAFAFLIIFTLVNVIAVFGAFSYNEFLLRSPQIGFLVEGILLSLGLAYKINLLKKAKSSAEKEAADNRVHKELTKLSRQVAHDIKSPLAALKTLEEFPTLDPAFSTLLSKTSERIQTILKDLSLQKMPDTQIQKIKPVNFNKLLHEITNEKELEYSKRSDVLIQLDLPFFAVSHDLDPLDFKRVMSNLINNAVEAKSEKKQDIHVSIKLTKTPDAFILKISDNGKGVPVDLCESIFMEGLSHQKESGSGLGLYHAKKSLQIMKLQLILESTTSAGTTFSISPTT